MSSMLQNLIIAWDEVQRLVEVAKRADKLGNLPRVLVQELQYHATLLMVQAGSLLKLDDFVKVFECSLHVRTANGHQAKPWTHCPNDMTEGVIASG